MKATGIVRRIDDFGRAVIPKEVRRTRRLLDGAPLLKIILRPYSKTKELFFLLPLRFPA